MAGTKALNVRMNFQVDTTQAKQQIQQLGAQLNSITKASNFSGNSQFGITSQILEATKAAAQLKTTIAEAINPLTGNLNLTAFNDQLRASGMSLTQYRDQLSSLGAVGNQTFNTLARSIATAETPLLRTGKAAQQMWTVLGNTVRWQATSSMLHGIMNTASQAMNYVKSLDSSLNSIRIVTGQNQAQMERFAQTANKAAKELNTSTNAYAKASLIYYQQGLSNAEVEKRVATTVKLANVSGQTAAKVSDQLTAIWNNFYDGSKSLEYYADVMTALGASTASSTDEIAKGLEKFSSIAKTTGLSYEYATSALSTVVAATRQSADSVGTSFKTLFSRLQGLSLGETLDDGTTLNKYSKALNTIGVNIKNANGSLKDMDDILDEIGDKWTSLSKAEQVALAQTVGGARNYTGLVSLMDNWDDFQTNLKTAQQAQGTLQNQADIYAESWEAASNHVRVASETIYKNLLNDQFFKGLTNGFGSVLDMVGSLTNSLGGFKGTMLTLGNAAFQIFKPQITQGLANIGLNARGIIRGQQDIIDIRTQARNALMAPVNFSRYNEVNQIQQQMNQNLNARQVLYESMQQKGKIPSYLQPAYQTMFNAINAQADEAIASAERVFGMDEQQRFAQIRTQQNLNYKAAQYNRQLKLDTQSQEGLQAYKAHTGAYMNGGLAGITGKAFTNYAEQYRATGIAATLEGLSRGDITKMTPEDSRRTASYITQMVSGSKQLGISFANTIPELETVNEKIQTYYKELSEGSKTQEEYNVAVHKAITENPELWSRVAGLVGPQATQLAKIEGDMLAEVYKAAGITDTDSTEAKEIRTNLRNVLNSSEMTEAARLESMRKLGVSDESAKAMLKSLEDQNATKNVMNYSAAIATSMNALAAMGQVLTSTGNLVRTFGDENATAGQQISAFTASAMSIGMAIKPWNDFKEHAGDTLKLFGTETSMTLKSFGGILAGLAVGAIALSAGIKEYQKTTDTGLIKNYNTQIATAAQLTSDARTKYEELLTTKDTHNNLLNNLQELQQGTSQFTNALINANDAAYQLIDNYDLIYGKDYHFDTNGAINFEATSLEAAEKQALEDYQNRQIGEQGLKYSKRLIELNRLRENDALAKEYTEQQIITQNNGKIGSNMLTAQAFINAYGQLMSGREDKSLENFLLEAKGQGHTYDVNELLNVFNVKNEKELNEVLNTLSGLDEYTEAGMINQVFAGYTDKYYSEMQSIMQGMAELSASSLSDTYKNTDLAAYAASQALSVSQGVELARFAGQATQKTWLEHLGIGTTPKEWYEQLFKGKSAEGLSDDEISTLVGEELIRLAYTDQEELMRRTGKTDLSDFGLTEFQGVKHYAEIMQSYNLPNLENLNYQEINDAFNRLLQYDESGNNALNTAENQTIQKYHDYAKQVYNNQLNDLSVAMLRGIGDGLLDGETKIEKGSEFERLVTNLAGQITNNNQEVMSSLTYGALKQATNAMINANEVGGATAETMYSLLLRGRTQTGGFDAATQAILQNYNFDNSLASIYSNNNLKRYAQNQAQRDKYIELFSSQIEDIGKEKGWFQMLYNSSGFSDVLDKINDQFQTTGQITAQYVTDLAGKSEELSQFLKVSADNSSLLSVNAGGLAAIFEEINRGTSGITASNISSEYISAMSKAESRSAANASAFEVVDNLDLGRSGLDFLDYFQDMGKQMYQADKAGWGFYSDPIQNIIDKIGGSKVKQVYMEANSHPDWNFQQMWNYMKTNPDSAGFMTFMESMAGKKGKGGGGPADVMKYLYDTLGGEGFSDEQWEKLGFKVGANGEFYLAEGQQYTQDQLVQNLTNLLKTEYGWTEEDANNYAQVIMSTASTSGQIGQTLDQRGAEAGFRDLFKGLISQEEYDAYYRRYGALMGYTSREEFDQDFQKRGGQIGLNLKKEEWNGITSQDLVKRAQEQGISIRNEYGEQEQVQNFSELADAYGAVTTGGKLDYNKLVTMIETMGGTEEDLIKMLEQDKDTANKLVAQSDSGKDIRMKEEETVRDYVNRIHEAQGDTTFAYSDLSAEAANMAYMYEHMIMSRNDDGTWSWHYETPEEREQKRQKAEAETIAERTAKIAKEAEIIGTTATYVQNAQDRAVEEAVKREAEKIAKEAEITGTTATYVQQAQDRAIEEEAARIAEKIAKEAEITGTTATYVQQAQNRAQKEAEERFATQLTEVDTGSEEYDRASFTAQMSPSEYQAYTNWIKSGGSGDPADWKYEKKAWEGPRAPNVGQNAENDAIIAAANGGQLLTDAAMRSVLYANGFSNRDIMQAQKEGISLEDLYQQISDNTDAVTTATETAITETLETQNNIAENLDDNLTAIEETTSRAIDTTIPSASQVSTPDEKLDQLVQLGTESLRQEKFINDNTGATADNVGDLSDTMSEQVDTANEEARMGGTFEEPEYDENGNQINLPSKQKSVQVGTSSSGGETANVGSSGGPLDKYKATGNGTWNSQDRTNAVKLVQAGVSPEKMLEMGYTLEQVTETQTALEAVQPKASGQNNARLLGYAKGKEGHIAVTGELGPELRVKSDGSMDLLGKTGREYTWVDSSDRIYTAAQTASILGSNNSIPQLEALAKGINNFIPGYWIGADWNKTGSGSGSGSGSRSSSSSSSSSSDKDPRYDPYTLKLRDVLERYYVILEKIDDITRAVEKFSAVADRAWGKDRIKAIEQQTEAYKQQYNAQKAYINEINEYLKSDTDTLETMINDFVEEYNEGKDDSDKISLEGAKYDSNGVLTNYDEIVTKLVEQYNENAEANASDDEAQTRYSERIKDIEKYRETLNLWESETDKLQDLANQILDNSLKVITYRVEYELELNADQERLLNFQADQVKDNVYRAAEYLDLLNEKTKITEEKLTSLRQGIYDYLGTLAGDNLKTGKTYSEVDLGIKILNDNGTEEAINYEDLNFQQITNNLDNWLSELRSKNIESAKEVEKIIQRNSSGIITNYKDVLLKINEMNSKLSLTSIQMLRENVNQFFEELSNTTNNPKWVGLSTEQKEWLTNSLDQIISYLDNISENYAATLEQLGDSIKEFNKKMDTELDEFSYYDDLYNSFKNIVDLTNTGLSNITSSFFSNLNNKALDNNINKIIATRKNYELFSKTLIEVQNQYNEMIERMNNATSDAERQYYQDMVDTLKSQLDIANAQMEEAHKDFLASWEDALSKIGENYKDALEQASKDFEKSFSPMFNTLALLQAQFDREKALGDLYVDNYQKLHDLNKLNRDIDKSIDDTDNLKSKARLRDLQKEITQLQEDGADLSEYDLDILDKKYKLELARQALEDARDAKSIVRLSRDNNGNWGYVYTADEDEIADAEQNYEDAIREMEEANQNYIDNIQDQILQVQQEAQQAILALQPEDFATYDDYLMAVTNIQNAMYDTLNYLRSQLNGAFANNEYLDPHIIARYGENNHNLTTGFDDTLLAGLLANNNLDSVIAAAKDNLQKNLVEPALEAMTIYSEKQAEVYQVAGKDIATAGEDFSNAMDIIAEKSNKQTEVVENLAKRIDKSFEDTANNVRKVTDEWVDSIRELTDEYTILLEAITKLKRADGEYVEPAKLINADNAIDSWKELSDFETALGNNGTLVLVTTDKQGNEHATTFKAGTQETNDFIQGAKNAILKNDIFDIGEDVDESENKKIGLYLQTRNMVMVRWTDSDGNTQDLVFNSIEEWEDWCKKNLKKEESTSSGNTSTSSATSPDFDWWYTPEAYHMGATTYKEKGWNTGGYTGRWQSAETGMYTGEWPMGSVRANGRLAWLHQKELVLNAHDTENFLDAMDIVRQLDFLAKMKANGLGDLITPNVNAEQGELEQNVHIDASFPNVQNHNEIEEAFTNLVNMASQYAYRKA